jgi:PhnB protein
MSGTPPSTLATTSSAPPPAASPTLVPYLCVHAGAEALEFYARALGATETSRIVTDDGRIGHAEFTVGAATIFLSEEFPEIGVVSPSTLGGTAVALHLQVPDVDAAFRRAVAAGAVALGEPADQPHGARHGTLRDPFGHRWMLSTPNTTLPAPATAPSYRGVWSAVLSHDALGLIRFAVEVLGFEEHLVVPDEAEPGSVVHSELRWPEGGVVQIATASDRRGPFAHRPVGHASLYVITTDPARVHQRCVDAGAEVVSELAEPDYDAGGSMFTVRDADGNLWTFGSYAG